MKILFGTDHAGFALKEALLVFVSTDLGHDVEDVGAHIYDTEDDYPDFIGNVAARISAEPDARGIVLGGSGQGEAMAANRFKGVRAAVYYGGATDIVARSREHNDANVLSIGACFVTEQEAKEAIHVWLDTAFGSEERHVRRIRKMDIL